ncbi:MAG: penicillin-binding protein 2 [Candidatus Kapabacteria bacterium]|nr:penicillin-binding protein 2 [Candidatus Kapabacteria bacterium]
MSLFPGDGTFGSAQRQRIFRILILTISLVYVGRLAWLQIIQGNAYKLKAEAQAIKQISTEPFRGMIFDRNGRAIVQNAPGFSITITPYEFTDGACQQLSKILGVSDTLIWQEVEKSARYNKFAAAKLSYGRDVEFDIIAAIEEQRNSLPGVDLIVDPKRLYAFDGNGVHLLGYTREVSENSLKSLGDSYSPGDLTGIIGLEKAYESNIRGQKGLQFVAVNKNGQRVASFNEGKNDIAGLEGDDLYLGLDTDLQELAEKLLGDSRGSIVALDPRNGEILCMASKPDFDPRKFSGKSGRSYYNEVDALAGNAMLNRATRGAYHPGSTWKPMMALMALQEGIITEKTKLLCAGGFRFGNRFATCHGGVHGMIDYKTAIAVSCNSFFYQLGVKIGIERFTYYGSLFGFGQRTRVDIGQELWGNLPSRAALDKAYGKGGWTNYVLMNWGIGQGELDVTPLQLCAYTAAIAMNGLWNQPHAVREIYYKSLQRRNKVSYDSRMIPIEKDHFRVVKEAMRAVVSSGTGRSVDIPGLDVCGKTGTEDVKKGAPPQSWFICFAPMNDPKIAMVVTGEGEGFGAVFAAPIARKLLENFFNKVWPADVPRDSMWIKKPGLTPMNAKVLLDSMPQHRGPFANVAAIKH